MNNLLDTNIIIYSALSEHSYLRSLVKDRLNAVSIVSHVETLGYYKITAEEKVYFSTIFNLLPSLPVNDAVIEKAINLRQEQKMSLGDSIIAATALLYDLTLVTRNVDDFKHILELTVIDPMIDPNAIY